MRAESDQHGSYVTCLICGYVKDDEVTPEEGDNSIPYIGNLLPMMSRRVPFQEIFLVRGKGHIVKRIISCPRIHRTTACTLEMAATGNTFESVSLNTGTWNTTYTRILNEFICERDHTIGITQGWTGWIEGRKK